MEVEEDARGRRWCAHGEVREGKSFGSSIRDGYKIKI
jgi:hypothetical protein